MARLGRRIALVLGLVILLVAAATVRLFIVPSTDAVRAVDAVVIFAGGRGERLQLAERLMDDDIAPSLVIPNGNAPEWPAGNRACTEARAYDVHCPQPSPDTTRGEAQTIGDLAEREGWTSVLLVTSTYHVSRAGLFLSRCFDGDVLTVSANPKIGPLTWISRIGHEWLAWSRSVVAARGC